MGLYTKIKGDMEFTNVGTPTITDGIVSGFTSSSYIKTNMPFYSNNKTWEFIFKIKFNTLSGRTTIVGDINVNNSCIQLGTNGTHLITYMSSKGASTWDIGSAITGTYTLLTGTYYYIKYEFTGTQYKASVSTDKITWTTDITINSSLIVFQGKHLSLGYNNGSYPEPLQGEINLNETTLKIGDTIWFGISFSKVKVNTGLVKYTVVGSPTINNGIASNFSCYPNSSSYIRVGTYTGEANSLEIKVKFKTGDTLGAALISAGGNGTSCVGIRNIQANSVNVQIRRSDNTYIINQSISSEYTFLTNTSYYCLLTFNNNIYSWKIFSENDVLLFSYDYPCEEKINNLRWSLGGSVSDVSYGIWNGSIDLNNSYIKINGGGFWRGSYQNINAWKIQQDNFSKYYTIVNGKLMWANPDIYLRNTDANYIDTGVIQTNNTRTIIKASRPLDTTIDWPQLMGGGNGTGQKRIFYNPTNIAISCRYYDSRNLTTLAVNNIFTVDYNKNKLSIVGGSSLTTTAATFTDTQTAWIFNSHGVSQYPYHGDIYYSKFYENDILIRHFVPVPKGLLIGNFVVPSNGMFDIVEQKFYENQGTREFEIGGIPEDYIIEGGKMIWCNPDIYLESTGTQYIETNHFANSGTLVEGSFQFTDTTVQQRVFGADSSYNTILYSLSIYINGSSKWAFSSNDGIGLWVSTNISKDTNKHTYKIGYPNGGYLYIDTTQSSKIGGTQNNTANQSLVVFADKKETGGISGFAKIKEWYFIIYQYSFIKQYLVPVPKGILIGDKIAPSNCMFDLVTQTFFENQGTGDFIIGGISGDYINVGDNIIWVDENVYLKSTRTQYIDTNYIPKNNTNVEFYAKFSGNFTTGSRVSSLYGISDTIDKNFSFCANFGGTSSQYSQIFFWITPYISASWSITNSNYNQKQIISTSNEKATWGTLEKELPERKCNCNHSMLIYGAHYDGIDCIMSCYDMQIYNYFKITEGTKIMRYFLPVNTNTVIGSFTVPEPGMWDAVTKKFYPNKGTGTFTYGKDT